ncbi:DUF2894 domain-containing protein [Parahaliea maris]|uniref:DUF2894 domain-containing protein n=1 Tax=Parahaliea maris TaxID=2716870 RepID=A0A5C8ZWT1_9GAMM|nr:DUF2894 domain-containing protein [Parahaliea maris]TXS93033.1 DUF2894 domain-containing protein [Parahaliea maris]
MTETVPQDTPALEAEVVTANGPDNEADTASGLHLPGPVPDVESLALDRGLAQLREIGAEYFDPPGFSYLDALVARAQGAEGQLAEWYEGRARCEMSLYADRVETARSDWVERARALYEREPALAPAINSALEGWNGRALARLEKSQELSREPGPLLALVSQIEALHRDSPVEESAGGLEHQLRQQELQLLAEYGSTVERQELRSARSYRQRMQRTGAEQLLAHSVAEAPQESGPLNPQKLATRALSTMQQLSPACSARFVSWLNTLLYLEKLDQS